MTRNLLWFRSGILVDHSVHEYLKSHWWGLHTKRARQSGFWPSRHHKMHSKSYQHSSNIIWWIMESDIPFIDSHSKHIELIPNLVRLWNASKCTFISRKSMNRRISNSQSNPLHFINQAPSSWSQRNSNRTQCPWIPTSNQAVNHRRSQSPQKPITAEANHRRTQLFLWKRWRTKPSMKRIVSRWTRAKW